MTELKKEVSFEESLAKLEEIVEKLESPDVPLADSIKLFQEGMMLSKACDETLQKFEENITVLSEKDGNITSTEMTESEFRK